MISPLEGEMSRSDRGGEASAHSRQQQAQQRARRSFAGNGKGQSDASIRADMVSTDMSPEYCLPLMKKVGVD